MADRVGERFGDYRLIRFLGQGTFGDVYLGEHVYDHTQAAVKVFKAKLTPDKFKDFINEVRTVLLRHPNIIPIIDFGIGEQDVAYLVMEYAPNGTLLQRHPRGTRLPLATIVSYVKQIAAALQYAHDQRRIHRDVKPENMFFGAKNEILLGDFGIAAVAHNPSSQRTEDAIGTARYMAPEQCQGKPLSASDQYALGVIVYEWLCGECPFSGDVLQLMYQHVHSSPPPLREKLPGIPAEVEQVVMTMLAKDPRQRFGSVQAFANALEQANQPGPPANLVLQPMGPGASQHPPVQPALSRESARPTEPVTPMPSESVIPTELIMRAQQAGQPGGMSAVAHPGSGPSVGGPPSGQTFPSTRINPSQSQSIQPPIITPPGQPEPQLIPELKRGISRRTVVGLGLGLAGLAVAGGGITWWILAPHPLYIYRGFTSGWVTVMAWSPDGKHIAAGGSNGTVQVWDASDEGNTYIYNNGYDVSVAAVAWSPDSRRVASGGSDHTVQVWDAADGSHVYTYRGHSDWVRAVAWSPDGKRIASGSGDRTVQVWDAADGNHVYTYRGHTDGVNTVAWSPDSRRVASGGSDHTVQVWDAADGSHVYTYRGHSDQVNVVAWSPDGKRIASCSGDRTVQVWDAADGSHVYTYRGHSDQVNVVAWSPDGKRIASCSGDGTVQVWDAADGSHVYTYRGHALDVFAVAWSPDGKRIASGNLDGTVHVWKDS